MTRRIKRALLWLSAAALFVFLVTPAQAFSTSECLGHPLKMRGDAGLYRFDNGGFSGPWRDAANDMMREANVHPGNFRLDHEFDTFHVSPGNGEAEIWWTRDSLWLNNGPAIAHYYIICFTLFFGADRTAYINENDIMFDVNEEYTFSHNRAGLDEYGGTGRLMQGTGLHELGHGMQLNHVNSIYNIMGDDWTHAHANAERVDVYWGSDASAGIRTLYGPRPWEDVSVSHWKFWMPFGEYSGHQRTSVLGLTGGVKPVRDVEGQVGYEVRAGETLIVEFTFENNGVNCQRRVTAGFVLSGNKNISVGDRRIADRFVDICPGRARRAFSIVTLPADLPPETPQWLGVILNERRAFAENVTNNNTAYIPLWIVP